MESRERFHLPNANTENSIRTICRGFGNPEIAGEALSPRLSEELKQAGEDIDHAKKLAEIETINKTLDINVESHTDAATRNLAIWGWLPNASDRLMKAGKTAETWKRRSKATRSFTAGWRRAHGHVHRISAEMVFLKRALPGRATSDALISSPYTGVDHAVAATRFRN
jgi:hypothetical protein